MLDGGTIKEQGTLLVLGTPLFFFFFTTLLLSLPIPHRQCPGKEQKCDWQNL